MNPVRSVLALVGMAAAVGMPAIAFAHPQQPDGTVVAQPVSWVVMVMLGALGLFVLIVSGATVLRVVRYRRRQPLAARTPGLLTASMAGCAVVALVAFVATQFMPPS
jgi:heme/copper-type cytochrome/quinol oxidase subunit 2